MSQPTDRKGYDRQVRYGRILGLFFCAAGFATIGFGWNGAARFAFVDQQFPYLISGGVVGLAQVLLGIGLLVMAQFRAERIKLTDQLEHLGTVVARSSTVGSGPGGSPNGRVVAGKSTYHRPECRLLAGKGDLDYLTVEAARASGLSPCRVCNPAGADEPEPAGEAK